MTDASTPLINEQSYEKTVAGIIAALAALFAATLDPVMGEYAAHYTAPSGDILRLGICEGAPSSYEPDALIVVASDARQTIERPTMGRARSREITAEVEMIFSVALAGSAISGQTARQAVNDMALQFANWLRVPGNETLSGACREAWMSSVDGPQVTAIAGQDGQAMWGKQAALTATITANIRQ